MNAVKRITTKSLSVLAGLTLMLALSAAPAFAADRPTGTTEQRTNPAGVSSITIGGETARYYVDSNGSTEFIRANVPTATTDMESTLESLTVVVNLNDPGDTVTGDAGMTFTGSGATRTATGVDLFNEAHDVTIDGTTYVLAAGVANSAGVAGKMDISSSDPLKVQSVTLNGTSATVYGYVPQSPYMGNPYFTDNNLDWTPDTINYYIAADSPLTSTTNRSAISGTMTLASGATASGCVSGSYTFDLDQNLNTMTVTNSGDTRNYFVSAAVDGQTVEVNYGIDLTEMEAATEYLDDVVDQQTGRTVGDQCQEIETAANVYFAQPLDVTSGESVMDVLEGFRHWAEDNGYFTMDTNDWNGTYIAKLDGIGEFDAGSLSGWMYTDEANGWSANCGVPMVGGADYHLTSDGTIDWFLTTDYMNHF